MGIISNDKNLWHVLKGRKLGILTLPDYPFRQRVPSWNLRTTCWVSNYYQSYLEYTDCHDSFCWRMISNCPHSHFLLHYWSVHLHHQRQQYFAEKSSSYQFSYFRFLLSSFLNNNKNSFFISSKISRIIRHYLLKRKQLSI